jgi:hypothetical protein
MPIHRTSIESAVPMTTTNELLNGNVIKVISIFIENIYSLWNF